MMDTYGGDNLDTWMGNDITWLATNPHTLFQERLL